MEKAEIGLIGLAVMGANLARNLSRNFSTIVFNRTTEKMEAFVKEFGHKNLTGEKNLKNFIQKIAQPRKIILMVKAGEAVDEIISQLTPLLDKDDILIDGGNSHYLHTEARQKTLETKGINFIGMGISGGEEGALNGPSMMPGGDFKTYKKLEKILQKSAASDGLNGKCVSYMGKNGSGHFVKMVHNGIEYGLMQLIAETYDLLKTVGKFSNKELAATFNSWSKSKNLKSFLIEITAKIFAKGDLINLIKDQAQQKGTGKWTSIAAFDHGVSTSIINSAVDARIISGSADLRKLSKKFPAHTLKTSKISKKSLAEIAKSALTLSTILTYYQGFELLKIANKENSWNLNLKEIARIWRGGCIIRSDLLDLFQNSPSKIFQNFNKKSQTNWRAFLTLGLSQAIPLPAYTTSLAYFDSLVKPTLPQNLTQAQRDFFGSHTYERTDKKGTFHTDWS